MARSPATDDRKQSRDGHDRSRMTVRKINWCNLGWKSVYRWHPFLCLQKGPVWIAGPAWGIRAPCCQRKTQSSTKHQHPPPPSPPFTCETLGSGGLRLHSVSTELQPCSFCFWRSLSEISSSCQWTCTGLLGCVWRGAVEGYQVLRLGRTTLTHISMQSSYDSILQGLQQR